MFGVQPGFVPPRATLARRGDLSRLPAPLQAPSVHCLLVPPCLPGWDTTSEAQPHAYYADGLFRVRDAGGQRLVPALAQASGLRASARAAERRRRGGACAASAGRCRARWAWGKFHVSFALRTRCPSETCGLPSAPRPESVHAPVHARGGISGTSDTDDPRSRAGSAQPCGCKWARQDSNLGPTDYESAALTAELRALRRCCLLYTSPSPRDGLLSRMPSSA